MLETDSGALNSVFVSSCICDWTREVTDSWNVFAWDVLQGNAVFSFSVSSCCTVLHWIELNWIEVLIVTDMWHLMLRIWFFGVVMPGSRVVDVEGTHYLHLQGSPNALDPGELFLMTCGIHLPSFCPISFPYQDLFTVRHWHFAHQLWYRRKGTHLYTDLTSIHGRSLRTPGPMKMKVVHSFKTWNQWSPCSLYQLRKPESCKWNLSNCCSRRW